MRDSATVGDTTITREDLQLIQNPISWLNDNIIGFYIETLDLRLKADANSTVANWKTKIKVLNPCVVSLLLLSADVDDFIPIFIELQEFELVLFPLNDNQNVGATTAAGSHWSLLIWDRETGFICMDSVNRMNHEAKVLAKKIYRHLGIQKLELKYHDCPKQTNAYDCGIYLCSFMSFVVQAHSNVLDHSEISSVVNQAQATRLRKQLAQDIQELLGTDPAK